MDAGLCLAASYGHGTMWGEKCRGGGSWAQAQREVWVDKHLAICHPGDLRHVFLERAEKVGYWRKK